MKKRKAISAVLAGLIAINTLGGCSDKNTINDSSKNDVIEATIDELISQLNITKSAVDEQNSQEEKIDKLISQMAVSENLDDTQTPQIDIIELPLNETDESFRNSFLAIKGKDINLIKFIKCNVKVTSIDMFNDPIYTRAVEIIKESTYPNGYTDADVKELYDHLKFINDEENDICKNYIFVGDVAYKVEIEYVYQYPAPKKELEDGTIVYYAPYGGILSGTQVINKKTIPLNSEATMSFLEECGYLINNNLELKLPFEYLK